MSNSNNRIRAQWPSEKKDICARVRAIKSELKIVLKTKDEQLLFPRWIKHHRNIVEPCNLIILDNMSTNDEVIRLYDALATDCILFQYDGAVNDLHHVELFDELYDAIRDSSMYYSVIDTDEFLYLFHEDRMIANRKLSTQLCADSGCVFPGFWLYNFPGQANTFFMSASRIDENMQWGKPIIPSSLPVRRFINHNIQMFYHCKPFTIRFGAFIAHLKRLDPVQRIEANLRKLKSFNIVPAEATAATLDLQAGASYPGAAAEYFREIAELSMVVSKGLPSLATIPPGCIQIHPDGTLSFGDEAAQVAFESIPERYSSHGIEVLSRPPSLVTG